MRHLHLTDETIKSLKSIARYIAETSGDRAVADRFNRTLLDRCRKLCALPGVLGRARPELRNDLRSVAVGNYVIFFRYVDDAVEIADILHGHRDIEAHFSDE